MLGGIFITTYDVVVVGAGPAGTTAAYKLAEKGIHTLLVDKASFPRDKPCGGGLPMWVLRRFPYVKELDVIESYTYGGFVHSSNLIENVKILKSHPVVAMVRRKQFDNKLLQLAVDNGVKFAGNTLVKHFEVSQNHGQVFFENGEKVSAKLVIGADGFHSIIAKSAGLKIKRDYRCICVYEEYPISEKVIDEFYTDKRFCHIIMRFQGILGYGWVFPKHQHINVGLGEYQRVDATVVQKHNLAEVFKRYMKALKEHEIVPREIKCKRLLGGQIPHWPLKKTYGNHVLLCGDAAGLINPVSGEGIYFSMASADIAANTAVNALEEGDFSESFLANYQKGWEHDFGRDIRQMTNSRRRWGKDSEEFIRLIRADKKLADMCLGIMTGELHVSEIKNKMIFRYLMALMKKKIFLNI